MTDPSSTTQQLASRPTHARPARGRHLVAVPDPWASAEQHAHLFRLGVVDDAPAATFTIGEHGPNNQPLPLIYLTSHLEEGGTARYEINLLDGELTVTSLSDDPSLQQTVVYRIDVEAMTGQAITKGEPVAVVFAYGEQALDETAPVDEWLATTGPKYPELDRLPLDTTVEEWETALAESKRLKRFGRASRAPRSARSVAEHHARTAAATPERADAPEPVIDLRDQAQVPEEAQPVQVPNPVTGQVFVGRRWERPEQATTLMALRDAQYRAAFLLMEHDRAVVFLNHESGRPVMRITTAHHGTREVQLEEWDAPIIPGERFRNRIGKALDGGREAPGQTLTTAPVVAMVATGPEIDRSDPPSYPYDDAIVGFHQLERERQVQRREQGIDRSRFTLTA